MVQAKGEVFYKTFMSFSHWGQCLHLESRTRTEQVQDLESRTNTEDKRVKIASFDHFYDLVWSGSLKGYHALTAISANISSSQVR